MTDLQSVIDERIETEAVATGPINSPKKQAAGRVPRWQVVADMAADRLAPGELAIVPAIDRPGPGGRVLIVARPDDPNEPAVRIMLTVNQTAAVVSRLAAGIDCATRHPG